MRKLYIYGASGHGLVVNDIAKACGYDDVIFVDDGNSGFLTFENIKDKNDIPIFIGVGDNKVRSKIYNKVKKYGFEIVSLIHPSSIISESASIGSGTVVMPNVIVNAQANVGIGVILNTGCIVEHECIVGDFAHLSPNVSVAGNTRVGNFVQLGIGTSVIQCLCIGDYSMIGAGSVVVKDIQAYKKAYGNPCREIEDIKTND